MFSVFGEPMRWQKQPRRIKIDAYHSCEISPELMALGWHHPSCPGCVIHRYMYRSLLDVVGQAKHATADEIGLLAIWMQP